ncbi:MAG: hypothetical protein AAF512_24495 [Pseudomonadota bacterium]
MTAADNGVARLWPGMDLKALQARVRDVLGDTSLTAEQRAAAFLPEAEGSLTEE